MSKKIKNMKWESVALDGFPISMSDKFHGFVGLEECTEYAFDKNKKSKQKNKTLKRKLDNPKPTLTRKPKKIKLSNGFVVEVCSKVSPSSNNENKVKNNINNVKSNKNTDIQQTNGTTLPPTHKIKKLKLGENVREENMLTPEDMLSWAEFKLPEEILKALMELGFKKPTNIQQLSLPAAIHGRRDILGAAETGSGKTLAFGLPILSGIIKIKEKAAAKGLDAYEIPYKKPSIKKNKNEIQEKVKTIKCKKPKIANVKNNSQKESSEDGYSSDNTDNIEETNSIEMSKAKESPERDFIEEYEVKLRKRNHSANEGSNSDDENYTHLSDMLDSDDLESIDGDFDNNDISNADDGEGHDSDDDDDEGRGEGDDEGHEEDDEQGHEEVDENTSGIGCVKVIDDVELPRQVMVKTGKPLYSLILTPTRELAIQISRHLIAAAKYTGIKIATVVGGLAAVKQERVLRSGPEVVVATPGRLWELINQGQQHLQQLASVKFLAIDETDRMLERGHFEELEPLLERLNAEESHRSARQNFVFSATLTMVHDLPSHMKGKKVTKRGKIINRKIQKMTPQQKIKKLINKIGMTDPKVVDITTKNLGTAETLMESRITCSLDQKDAHLYYILKKHPGRTIVFCNSIGSVRRLTQLFTILKCKPLPLHASMPQRQRLKNLERFRDDRQGVLVATDVAARGLDIPNVDHVIHYQVPKTAENYVHRSGRTARANKEGLTILMMEPAEAFSYVKLCRTLNKTTELATFPILPHSLAPMKDLVNIARELDVLMLKKKRTSQAIGWREKAAKELDIIIDEDDIPSTKADPGIDKALQAKKRQLDSMLSKPFFPKGFSFKYPTLNDPTALQIDTEENALEAMKKALESGDMKRDKRRSKNQSLLQLQKTLKK